MSKTESKHAPRQTTIAVALTKAATAAHATSAHKNSGENQLQNNQDAAAHKVVVAQTQAHVQQAKATLTPQVLEEALNLGEEAFVSLDDDDDTVQAPERASGDAPKDDDDFFSTEDKDVEDFGRVQLFKPECLKCAHLVSFATKKYTKCHFSVNPHCPAASLQLVVRIPLEKIVNKFIAAERTGDNSRLARLYALLATKEFWYQDQVQKALAQARKVRQ